MTINVSIPSPSPTYNSQYSMTQMFDVVDVTTGIDILIRPGQRTLMLDYLDQGWTGMLNQIRFWNNDVYRGQKWTTLCYQWQGTSALWLFNLAFNGLDAPWALQPGMVVRFPTIPEIKRVMALQTANDGTGAVITI